MRRIVSGLARRGRSRAGRSWVGRRYRLSFGMSRATPLAAGRGERGVIGVMVVILLGCGVLVGVGALVIDVGQIYQYRAEVQNGADAAAMAIARTCAVSACDTSVAATYAANNSHTGKAMVDSVCGSGTLGGCTGAGGTALDACPANPSAGTNYVDVTITAETASGSTLIPPTLAGELQGNSSYQGTTVTACAQAEWGGPSAANTVAITISACEWDAATGQGTNFAAQPPTVPPASYDQVLLLHTSTSNNGNSGCATEPAGSDGPGMFGWTADDTGTCSVYVSASTYNTSTGTSASNACKTAIATAWSARSLIYIPVYTKVVYTGNNGVYTLKGFAAFVVTGYRFPGSSGTSSASDWLNPSNDCRPPNTCLNGYFTHALIPASPPLSGTNLGTSIVVLS